MKLHCNVYIAGELLVKLLAEVHKITRVPPIFLSLCVTPSVPPSTAEKEGTPGDDQVKSMLQAIASRAGIEIDFEEESSYSDDSEYENEEGEGEEGEGEEGEGEGQGKEGGKEEEGGMEEGRKEGDGVRGGETKREEEGETNSERGNGEEKREEEGEQEEENRVATVNCGTDESQSRKISSEDIAKGGPCSSTKTSLTSSEQVSESPKPTAPPLCEDPSSVAVNGVLDGDAENNGHQHGKAEGQCERGGTDGKGPCGTEDIGDCKSPCDKDDSSRTETTQSSTEDGRLTRNHTLLGLLTSTISRPQNHRVSCMYHNYGISIAYWWLLSLLN